MVVTRRRPIVQNGYIDVPEEPGLGILALNDDHLEEYRLKTRSDKLWNDTDDWDYWPSYDRLWL